MVHVYCVSICLCVQFASTLNGRRRIFLWIACYIKVTSFADALKAFPLAFAWVEEERERERERESRFADSFACKTDGRVSVAALTHSLVISVASGMDEDAVWMLYEMTGKEKRNSLKVGWEER